MERAIEIIWDYIGQNWGWNGAQESLMRWLSDDDVVRWFVDGFFVRDENDMRKCMPEEDVQEILDYYNLHCA